MTRDIYEECDYESAIWLPAAKWSGAARPPGQPSLIVLHSTETACRAGTAKAVARWFARGRDCRASAHYVVDVAEIYQCVRERHRAWAAGPIANARGVHVELCGRAFHTDWSSGEGLEVLKRAAPLVCDIARRHNIPLVRLDCGSLIRNERGLVTHASCSAAWRESTHVDPGGVGDLRWPWELWLDLLRECSQQTNSGAS